MTPGASLTPHALNSPHYISSCAPPNWYGARLLHENWPFGCHLLSIGYESYDSYECPPLLGDQQACIDSLGVDLVTVDVAVSLPIGLHRQPPVSGPFSLVGASHGPNLVVLWRERRARLAKGGLLALDPSATLV